MFQIIRKGGKKREKKKGRKLLVDPMLQVICDPWPLEEKERERKKGGKGGKREHEACTHTLRL